MSEALQSPSSADARALVDRIAVSAGFQRSPRLRELLRYIVDVSLSEPPITLTEQQIGAAVFNRSAQYDTTSDTIVRVQVSQLRKRIEHYFLTEGEHERLLLEIPRGSYNAVFQARTADSQHPPPPVPFDAPLTEHAVLGTGQSEVRPDRRIPLLLAAAAILAGLCVFLGFRLWRGEDSGYRDPAVRALWSNLIRPQQKTSIILADSGFGFLQDALGHSLDLDRYLQHDPQQWVEAGGVDPQLARTLSMLSFRQYTSIGDVVVARRILNVNPALQAQISIVFARSYNARGPASDNVILLGSQRSNPWVQVYLDRINFYFDYDEVARKAIVRNRKPAAGEKETYKIAGEGAGIKEGYAVIAFLPNQTRMANVLMLAGTDMEATEAVGVLATSEGGLAPVLSKIVATGKLPYFEALFRTHRLAGAPQECTLVAWRRIAD